MIEKLINALLKRPHTKCESDGAEIYDKIYDEIINNLHPIAKYDAMNITSDYNIETDLTQKQTKQ